MAYPTKTLSRSNFARVFEGAYNETVSKTSVISNGFRKCGLYPLDPNSVDYTKCVITSQVAQEHSAIDFSNSISELDIQGTMKVLKHLTSDSDINYFNACIAANKTHDHPYFPIWHFCKSFLSSGDVPLLQQQQDKDDINTALPEKGLFEERESILPKLTQVTEFDVVNGECVNENGYVLSELTHVTEFDEVIDSTSTPLGSNITGLDIDVLLADENLMFDCHGNNSSITSADNNISKQNTDIMKTAIPLPWYDDKIKNVENPIVVKTTPDIDAFLSVPCLNHPARKRKTAIMPYGITSIKMKDYFNDQDNKKREKEESIKIKKALRIAKTEALEAKKETNRKKRALKENNEKAKNIKDVSDKSSDRNKITSSAKNTSALEIIKKQNKTLNSEKQITDLNTLNEPDDTRNINRDLTNFTYGDYILVKFVESKYSKLFVGKILMINHEEQKIKVDFLRIKKQNKFESQLFIYPQVKDIYEVHIQSVLDILEVQKTTRRGEIIFTKHLKNVQ